MRKEENLTTLRCRSKPRWYLAHCFQKTSLKNQTAVLEAKPICSFKSKSPGREEEGTSLSAVLPR